MCMDQNATSDIKHSYVGYDHAKINAKLQELRRFGMTVTGNNPWEVDTRREGIKLHATFCSASGTLTVIPSLSAEAWEAVDGFLGGAAAASPEDATLNLCGTWTYTDITQRRGDCIVQKMKNAGMGVSPVSCGGDYECYDIDTNNYGVKLSSKRHKTTLVLTIEVKDYRWPANCDLIRPEVDKFIGDPSCKG